MKQGRRKPGQISRRTLLTCACVTVIVAASIYIIYWFTGTSKGRAPVYDYRCAKCEHSFTRRIRDVGDDVPIVECPKCAELTAERVTHFQCRKCWEKFDMRGSETTQLANLVCPHCGNTALRNLDHPIPGDDQPVEGALPRPD
ncbi:MAG: FmdB family zinc ribbon protein [Planctomycetota bacterium]|jgi:putative FmdB family regulatory protein